MGGGANPNWSMGAMVNRTQSCQELSKIASHDVTIPSTLFSLHTRGYTASPAVLDT